MMGGRRDVGRRDVGRRDVGRRDVGRRDVLGTERRDVGGHGMRDVGGHGRPDDGAGRPEGLVLGRRDVVVRRHFSAPYSLQSSLCVHRTAQIKEDA